MPATEESTMSISCDNPACPGNDLDPTVRTGWLFVSHEVYGEPTQQHVFCSYTCLSAASGIKGEDNPIIAKPSPPIAMPPVVEPLPTPAVMETPGA